ncbi:PMD domain-containing protein [Cephalotus follicularis]|uniref:PMD domain-containing protein n=1 Tax=Cephalotus follicularis TaxID=3775 RepID=A0A1Q3C1L2_CEPFO|nr:PMD domain-containing protein [Cephalotus follicularis]
MVREKESLNVLVSQWCFETHTFVVAWGYFIVTLEDVIVLFHLPLVGKVGPSSAGLLPHEEEKINTLCWLVTVVGKYRYHIIPVGKAVPFAPLKHCSFNSWIRYFFKEVDKGDRSYEGEGFKIEL